MVATAREGVERATTTVDDLRGDSQAFLDDVADQMRDRIAEQTDVREGLAAQVARLDVLIAHQTAQLDQLLAASASFPSPDEMPVVVVDDVAPATGPNLGDAEVPLSDRVHTALEAYGPMDRDGLVELFHEAGDDAADDDGVGGAITTLVEADRATKDEDGWVTAV